MPSLMRAWAGGQRTGQEGARAQDDPRTAKSRLPRRTFPGSIDQPGMIARDFRPWFTDAACVSAISSSCAEQIALSTGLAPENAGLLRPLFGKWPSLASDPLRLEV